MCSKRGMAGGGGGAARLGRWGRRLCGRLAAMGMMVAAAAGWRAAAAAEPPVAVAAVDHAGLMREVARHRGKVVVLDCWSTSCPPCVQEFPGLVRLAAAHPDRVACLSLAVDYEGIGTPEDVLPAVREFLERVGAGRVINMVSTEESDAIYRKLDLASVPAVYVWRPDGSLAVRFDDDHAARSLGRPFTYDDVEAAVAGLLDGPR